MTDDDEGTSEEPDTRLHGTSCRKRLEYMMPEYGSECTCGLEAMIEILNEVMTYSIDNNPEDIAAHLNNTIYWRHKDEGRDPFACWCGSNDDTAR